MSAQQKSIFTPELRNTARFVYETPCILKVNGTKITAKTHNISIAGIRIHIADLHLLKSGGDVVVEIQDLPPVNGVFSWIKPRSVGIQFKECLTAHPEILALVKRLENGEPAGVT